MDKFKKVAIVYDWVNQWGGAERVVSLLADLFPASNLYTGVYDRIRAPWAKKKFKNIHPSFLNGFPLVKANYYWYFSLFPLAFKSFSFDQYDLVISVTSFAGKFIITNPKTLHICYCLTPPRFLWQRESLPNSFKKLFPFLANLRIKDVLAAQRPNLFLTSCQNTSQRIKKFYRRKAEVIYPGVDLQKFKLSSEKRKKYFLLASRLVEYKKTDLVVSTFNKLGWPLKIIGTGRQEGRLKKMAKNNIEFLGQVSENILVPAYQQAKAVIFPQEEDFGLVPIEAQACGTPVLAYGRGGALETIIPSQTGEFFSKQNEKSLIQSLHEFKPEKYKAQNCRMSAERFSKKSFIKNFKKVLEIK